MTYNSRAFSGRSALSWCLSIPVSLSVFVCVYVLSTGGIFHLRSSRLHLRSSTQQRDPEISRLSQLRCATGPSFWEMFNASCVSQWQLVISTSWRFCIHERKRSRRRRNCGGAFFTAPHWTQQWCTTVCLDESSVNLLFFFTNWSTLKPEATCWWVWFYWISHWISLDL